MEGRAQGRLVGYVASLAHCMRASAGRPQWAAKGGSGCWASVGQKQKQAKNEVEKEKREEKSFSFDEMIQTTFL